MTAFKIASVEGAQRYGGEVGTVVDLDLDDGEELALVCAGWLEHTNAKPTVNEEANT